MISRPDSDAIVTVNPRELKYVLWHEELPEAVSERAKAVLQRSCNPMPFEQWEFGFCHDLHPEREIAIWERYCDWADRFFAYLEIEPGPEQMHAAVTAFCIVSTCRDSGEAARTCWNLLTVCCQGLPWKTAMQQTLKDAKEGEI